MAADPADPNPSTLAAPAGLARLTTLVERRTAHLSPTSRALLWVTGAGLCFSVLNTVARTLTQQLEPMQVQFLRYAAGLAVMLPLVLRAGVRAGLRAHWPVRIGGQFSRGALHTVGLGVWFFALPHTPLADTTAIGFTTPIFIMIGAHVFLGEPMRWERWLATGVGFAGVLVVVGPKLAGGGGFWQAAMLATSPLFAASFLLSKTLSRYERTEVIVLWQAVTVAIYSLPFALWSWRWPGTSQWWLFLGMGLIGSVGHYCVTRSFRSADISATQSAKFLDLVWAGLLGWLVFAEVPTLTTLAGGGVIAAATLWLARRESRLAARDSA